MTNLLACNIGSYGKHRSVAYEHLASIGVRHVEIRLPAPEEVDTTLALLRAHGLTASTLNVPCDASTEEGVASFASSLDTVERMGIRTVFVSVKQGVSTMAEACSRLRRMAESAAEKGVMLAVETHPELAHNAAVALETLRAVDHPNVRLNFDTGNIYFYNQDADAVAELRQVVDQVAAVHLKDTNGGYRAWHFPALGEGVVDFPAVFRILNERGFYGPFTMELEGIQGETLTGEQQKKRVAASVGYLRERGLIG